LRTRHTRAIAVARVKTDVVHARTLTYLLCADLLPESYIAPQVPRSRIASTPSSRDTASSAATATCLEATSRASQCSQALRRVQGRRGAKAPAGCNPNPIPAEADPIPDPNCPANRTRPKTASPWTYATIFTSPRRDRKARGVGSTSSRPRGHARGGVPDRDRRRRTAVQPGGSGGKRRRPVSMPLNPALVAPQLQAPLDSRSGVARRGSGSIWREALR
jgi:hypothetical protein